MSSYKLPILVVLFFLFAGSAILISSYSNFLKTNPSNRPPLLDFLRSQKTEIINGYGSNSAPLPQPPGDSRLGAKYKSETEETMLKGILMEKDLTQRSFVIALTNTTETIKVLIPETVRTYQFSLAPDKLNISTQRNFNPMEIPPGQLVEIECTDDTCATAAVVIVTYGQAR